MKKTTKTKVAKKIAKAKPAIKKSAKAKVADKRHIVCAWAERASGPGWSNSLVWYITRDGNGVLRQECLQPDEQSHDIRLLYETSRVSHLAFMEAVGDVVNAPKGPLKN